MDPMRYITYRLYRQHTIQIGSVYIKDLSKLGRDLKKVIIVDNMPANFQLQQENGIFIKSWVGDPKDIEHKNMATFLIGNSYKDIAKNTTNDIRISLKAARKKSEDEKKQILNLSV